MGYSLKPRDFRDRLEYMIFLLLRTVCVFTFVSPIGTRRMYLHLCEYSKIVYTFEPDIVPQF